MATAKKKVPAKKAAAKKVAAENLTNVKLLVYDINNIIDAFNENSIQRFYINFCDHWHKPRHMDPPLRAHWHRPHGARGRRPHQLPPHDLRIRS